MFWTSTYLRIVGQLNDKPYTEYRRRHTSFENADVFEVRAPNGRYH